MPNDTVDLLVNIRYYGPKAQHFSPHNYKGMQILREDLLTLKLPHPKQENTTFVRLRDGTSECSFFWASVTRWGTLHKQLSNRIHARTFEEQTIFERLLADLSIRSMTLQEDSLPPPFTKPPLGRNRNRTSSGLAGEVQWLLDDITSTFKVPKQEPTEPSVHDSVVRHDSVASSVPSARARSSDIIPPRFSNVTPMSEPALPPKADPRLMPPVTTPIPPAPAPLEPNPPSPSGPSSHRLPSPTRPSRKRTHSPDDAAARTSMRPPPKASEISTIQKLTRELWDLRRQITAGVSRETAILNELRALDSEFVPEALTQVKSTDDFVNRMRLETVEKELQQERKRRIEAEAMLEDIKRESKAPFVVPALFEAFVMISKITTGAMDLEP